MIKRSHVHSKAATIWNLADFTMEAKQQPRDNNIKYCQPALPQFLKDYSGYRLRLKKNTHKIGKLITIKLEIVFLYCCVCKG